MIAKFSVNQYTVYYWPAARINTLTPASHWADKKAPTQIEKITWIKRIKSIFIGIFSGFGP